MRGATRTALLIALLAGLGGASGCGGGEADGPVVESPESKKAGDAGRDAMKAFMESKSAEKARPKS